MLSKFIGSYVLLGLASVFSSVKADCASFGIDFQDGGSYFINSLDTSDFTSVTQFKGCTGTANVILEAPDENSWLCSDVSTSPDDTNEISTCPITKSQMYNGTWTIVILDNNGDNPSFSAQRTFQLIVAPQQTVTYTPIGLSITSETTPSTTSTSFSTETDTTTLNPVTITTVKTAKGTVSITPKATTVYSTIVSTRTITKTSHSNSIIFTTKTATCSIPKKPSYPDPSPNQAILAIAQSVLGITTTTSSSPVAATTTTTPGKSKHIRDLPISRAEFIRRNAVARELFKRAPDVPTLTITDTNTADWVTTTTIITDATLTITAFATVSTTLTVQDFPHVFNAISYHLLQWYNYPDDYFVDPNTYSHYSYAHYFYYY